MSFIHDIPDFEDKFIGYAILAFMGYFMYLWLTSGSSPLPQFAFKSQIALMVAHLEVILVAVIPLTLAMAVQSMRPNTGSANRAIQRANQFAVKVEAFRKTRAQVYKTNKIYQDLQHKTAFGTYASPEEREIALKKKARELAEKS